MSTEPAFDREDLFIWVFVVVMLACAVRGGIAYIGDVVRLVQHLTGEGA